MTCIHSSLVKIRMLTNTFLDWWFSPWSYSRTGLSDLEARSLLSRRDGYRLWCAQLDVPADLPRQLDPAWEVVAFSDTNALITAARLFAGLVAIHRRGDPVIDSLSFSDRKWCLGIASIQPLRSRQQFLFQSEMSAEVSGLTTLAWYLRRDFPGMWNRLRLLLPPALSAEVNYHLQIPMTEEHRGPPVTRIQRCWRLCRERAEAPRGA